MLPWSGARESISNRYHETIPGDTREWIAPDLVRPLDRGGIPADCRVLHVAPLARLVPRAPRGEGVDSRCRGVQDGRRKRTRRAQGDRARSSLHPIGAVRYSATAF